jgi:predicted SAM-dependent methyltransferase
MIKLHLGCGWRNFGPEWVHIDGGDYDHVDDSDICNLSYDDETVDLIYSSHVLEYFDRSAVVGVLSEWYRVLKPNGIIRIAVPDFYNLSKLYLSGDIELSKILGPLYGKMKMSNKTIYHKTVYDFNDLSEILTECGFLHVKKYDWRNTEHAEFDDHSQAYIPHMDKDNGTLISLNVEATKKDK